MSIKKIGRAQKARPIFALTQSAFSEVLTSAYGMAARDSKKVIRGDFGVNRRFKLGKVLDSIHGDFEP